MKRFSALLPVLFTVTAWTQTVTHKAVFQQGQQFEKIAFNKSEMSLSRLGQNETLVNELSLTMLITVDKVTDTGYFINNTVTRKQLELNGTEEILGFDLDSDSAKDRESNMGKELMRGVGQKSQLFVDKNGKIILSEDTSSLMEDITAASGVLANVTNAARRPGQNFELIAPIPKKPMKVGDNWSDTVHIDSTHAIVNYRVRAINNDEVTIAHTGNVSNVAYIMEDEGEKMWIRTEGTMTGNFTFDPKTGVIRTSINTTIASGTFEVRNRAIPVSIKTVNTTTIKLR